MLTQICVAVTGPQWINYDHFYTDDIMSAMAFQIDGVSMVCLTVCSGADQRKHQSSALLAFVRGIHRWPIDDSYEPYAWWIIGKITYICNRIKFLEIIVKICKSCRHRNDRCWNLQHFHDICLWDNAKSQGVGIPGLELVVWNALCPYKETCITKSMVLAGLSILENAFRKIYDYFLVID